MNDSLFQVYCPREVIGVRAVRSLLQICVVAIVWLGCLNCCAQTETPNTETPKTETPQTEVDPSKLLQPLPTASTSEQELVSPGISYGMTIPSEWEFGLQVDSPAATANGIKATFPVPRVWPEQEVELVEEFQTDNVIEFERKKAKKWTEQFGFSVKKMPPGTSEKAYVRFRVKKKMIQAPKDTTVFVKAKKVPGQLKEFLKPSPLIESRNKRIRAIAKELADDSLNAWDQVEKNYTWVRENITYKFDAVNRSCLEALDNKHGDCGELSSLFIAICRAQGVPARSVWIPGHVYPEFYLHDQDGKGHWFPCQAAGTYSFGSMAEIRPILQKGDRFKMPGQKEEVRYVRPTVEGFGAPVSIQWIRREITDQTKR